MAIATLGDLKAAIASFLNRSNLVEQIPTFIQLAEARIAYGARETPYLCEPLRIRAMETEVDIAISGQNAPLPEGYLQARRFTLGTDPVQELAYVVPDLYWRTYISVCAGTPARFTVEGEDFVFGPVPDGPYTGTLLYYKKFAPLTDNGDSNWLLANAPGVYLHGALLEAWRFSRNLAQAADSHAAFMGAVNALNAADHADRYSGSPWTAQPDGIKLCSGRSSPTPFDDATIALLRAFAVPPDIARAKLIDATIGALKAAGLWAKLDMLYLLAAHDAQAALLNWINPGANTLTLVNAPVFTTDSGYTGDGVAGYLDCATPINSLSCYQQNSAHGGVWATTGGNASNAFGLQVNGALFLLRTHDTLGGSLVKINTTINLRPVDGLTTGHVIGTRLDGATQYGYRNGGGQASGAAASIPLTADNFTLLRANNGYSNQSIAAAHLGGGLTASDAANMYAALQAYLSGVSAI